MKKLRYFLAQLVWIIPPTDIMFYFDWVKMHEEQIARDEMNAEYKDIINEIEAERKKLKV